MLLYWWWLSHIFRKWVPGVGTGERECTSANWWATVSAFNFRCRTYLFRYVPNQPSKANSAFHLSWVGKWVPDSAGKAKAGMVHSVSGCTRCVQVKLWDPLRSRQYDIQIHVYLYVYLHDRLHNNGVDKHRQIDTQTLGSNAMTKIENVAKQLL